MGFISIIPIRFLFSCFTAMITNFSLLDTKPWNITLRNSSHHSQSMQKLIHKLKFVSRRA